ncbi:MAG: 1-deoxy-D-xylulose-5-phosphate reductoisomerase [Kiritimatiellia bacterium]|jgi:1-deoxy-D-xylulose-5-phosphate reductoisomerase
MPSPHTPPRPLVILGSTGSIGENALRVAAAEPGRFAIAGLAANRSVARLLEQARQFRVPRIAVADPAAAAAARREAPDGVEVLSGPGGVDELAGGGDVGRDALVLCALVGMAGLKPVLAAIAAGRDIALATKETLVAAGAPVMAARAAAGVRITPVDSEHSAIFQCLCAGPALPACVRTDPAAPRAEDNVKRLIVTASGGPFAARPEVDFDRVTAAQALDHPRWSMGRKVTIDSATMMNKGLELLEARWLFDIPVDRIDVLVHPESIVHSLVEYADGSVLAQLAPADMRYAINAALNWPRRIPCGLPSLDLAQVASLHFSGPDENRFPCLPLARRAAAGGGLLPTVMNAANEVAVEAFLSGAIPFSGIWKLVGEVMDCARVGSAAPDLDAIFAADAWARGEAAGRLPRG